MPRKNRPDSTGEERRRRTSRRQRHRARQEQADGIPGDLTHPDPISGAGGDLTYPDPVRGAGGGSAHSDPVRGAAGGQSAADGQAPEGRLLGVDFGERRVGLALSDSAGLIAQGLETIEVKSTGESLESIASIAEAEQVLEIVLGLPVNMDGTKGEMAGKVEAFAGLLQDRVSCAVRTWDERMTSISARRAMHEMGMETRGNKGRLDRIAATLLLQNYLDYRRRAADETEPHD